jgi:hypothetical protein
MEISGDTSLNVSMYITECVNDSPIDPSTKEDDTNLNESFMREWDESLRENEVRLSSIFFICLCVFTFCIVKTLNETVVVVVVVDVVFL